MHRVALSLYLATLAACGTIDAPRPPAPATFTLDTLPGGIPRITSTAAAWSDTSGWRFVEERVIDPADDSPALLDGAPAAMTFDEAGNLYVMRRNPLGVVVFDTAGAYARTIGRAGDGPGEILLGTLSIVGDTLLVHQGWGSRLSWFRLDGTFLEARPSPAIGRWTLDPVITDTAGRTWLVGAMLTPRPAAAGNRLGYGPGWVRIAQDGTIRDTVAMPRDSTLGTPKRWQGSVNIEGQRAAAAMEIPLQAAVFSSPRHDGLVIHGRNDGSTLLLSRDGRDTVRIIQLPLPETPMTDADRAAVLAEAAPESSPFHGVAKPGDLPATWPRFTRLVVDHADRTWLVVPGNGRRADHLLVLDRDGALLGRVPVPAAGIEGAAWGIDRLAVPGEDAEGRAVIRIYRLEKGGTP